MRTKQVTPGSLILAAKSNVTSLGELSEEEWSEFKIVCDFAEAITREKFGAEKFNYLALMMKDPNVHFHFIPRYSKPVEIEGRVLTDNDWPIKTSLEEIELSEAEFEIIRSKLKNEF